MTARAPIPAAVRVEFTAPEGATVHCPGCVSHPDPHDLQVVDVEVIWGLKVKDERFDGFCLSLRLTGEDPTCEVTLGGATESWLEDMVSATCPAIATLGTELVAADGWASEEVQHG